MENIRDKSVYYSMGNIKDNSFTEIYHGVILDIYYTVQRDVRQKVYGEIQNSLTQIWNGSNSKTISLSRQSYIKKKLLCKI